MEFVENYKSDWKNHGLQIPNSRIHSKFSVTNQKGKDLWEDTSNIDMRPQQTTQPKLWRADDDGEMTPYCVHTVRTSYYLCMA
jgi:hypothetical protein